MIGNDIIDRSYALKNSKILHPRWIEKVLMPSEKELLSQFNNPTLALSVFWSLKESAYKIFFKKTLERKFIPKKFRCVLSGVQENKIDASIETSLGTWYGKVFISQDNLHAIVSSRKEMLNKIRWRLISLETALYAVQSKQVHKSLKEDIGQRWQLPFDQLKIVKEQNVPKVFFNNEVLPIDISMSHHHKWGAFALHFTL